MWGIPIIKYTMMGTNIEEGLLFVLFSLGIKHIE